MKQQRGFIMSNSAYELLDYFETFTPNRVGLGKAVPKHEMVRRLAHYLHVPQKFGERLVRAFEEVMKDALLHGEGLRIAHAGILTLHKHKTSHVMMFNKPVERKILYKYKWYVSDSARRFLAHISELDRQGVIDDFFSEAGHSKFQVD